MTLKELLCEKVNCDYEVFKKDTLGKSIEEVFSIAYKIHLMKEIMEVICINAESIVEQLSPEKLNRYLDSSSLLETLYSEWIRKEDGCFRELTDTIMNIIAE